MRGPIRTIAHFPVRVDDAVGLFRGQRLNRVLLALAHVVIKSKPVEEAGTERRGEDVGVGRFSEARRRLAPFRAFLDHWPEIRHPWP